MEGDRTKRRCVLKARPRTECAGDSTAETERVALVVVTLRSDADTQRLLDTAARAGYDSAVVVDCGNGSSIIDGQLGSVPMTVSVLRPGGNIGYGPGCNLGARHALEDGARTLVLANPDIKCGSGLLDDLVHRCKVGELAAPVLLRPDGRIFNGGVLSPSSGATAAPPRAEIAWVSTALVAISATDWRIADGFDPRFFIYWDDVDLCTRLIERGCRIKVESDLKVTHIGRGSQRGARGDRFYAFMNCRNRLLYAKKHAKTRRTLIRWVLVSPAYALRVADLGRRRRAGRLWACATGTTAGLRELARHGRWGPPRSLLEPE